ncbi:MAG TPA: hypothetical protein PLN24_08965 [Victivallales bacterium]|nr:hypothetical protein [Victivallales bacterium]
MEETDRRGNSVGVRLTEAVKKNDIKKCKNKEAMNQEPLIIIDGNFKITLKSEIDFPSDMIPVNYVDSSDFGCCMS